MTCEKIRPKLNQFLLKELPDTECREMETHLAGCEACRSETAGLEQWKQLIRSAGKRFSTSPQFRKRLEEQGAPDRAPSRWLPRSGTAPGRE